MHPYAKSFLTAALVLISAGLWAQEVYHAPDPKLLARFSYDSSALMREQGVRHLCFTVSRDGDYRIVLSLDDGQTQRLRGQLPKDQLQLLKTLLGSAEFQGLPGNRGGLIRRESESFAAEIPMPGGQREDGTQRLQWLNADGETPFPDSVASVVSWLKHFEPTNGKLFEYADYPEVCPSGELRLLQPSVAANLNP
jgi:hypothetical protein